MKKICAKIRVSDYSFKYKTKLETEPNDLVVNQLDFLKKLVDGGMYWKLLDCGPGLFEKATIYKVGDNWVCELENVVHEDS